MKLYATPRAGIAHTSLPQFVVHGNAIYAHPANRTAGSKALPWFEKRGNNIYSTAYNPNGHSTLPWYQVRGNKVFSTIHNPTGHSPHAAFKIR